MLSHRAGGGGGGTPSLRLAQLGVGRKGGGGGHSLKFLWSKVLSHRAVIGWGWGHSSIEGSRAVTVGGGGGSIIEVSVEQSA